MRYCPNMKTSTEERRWTVRSAADLGRALSGARAERHLTQAALAEETGIHRSYLAALESGDAPMVIERTLRAFRRMGATITVSLPVSAEEDPRA